MCKRPSEKLYTWAHFTNYCLHFIRDWCYDIDERNGAGLDRLGTTACRLSMQTLWNVGMIGKKWGGFGLLGQACFP